MFETITVLFILAIVVSYVTRKRKAIDRTIYVNLQLVNRPGAHGYWVAYVRGSQPHNSIAIANSRREVINKVKELEPTWKVQACSFYQLRVIPTFTI